MIKFIDYWMFAHHIWNDAKPTPVVINLRDVTRVEQINVPSLGGDIVGIFMKNNIEPIPIDGDIIEVLAEFQKHLQKMY